MESNGKSVTTDGRSLGHQCGSVIIGEPGTNGQHSFYQLMHQGTIIPAEFIGFIKSQTPIDNPEEDITNHDELMSNFFAQADALAIGRNQEELRAANVPEELLEHRQFTGNRPSMSLLFEELTPYTCGQLLAIYEHMVAVGGFIYNVNSFDQWGVELGKVLAKQTRKVLRKKDPIGLDEFNSATARFMKKYLDKRDS